MDEAGLNKHTAINRTSCTNRESVVSAMNDARMVGLKMASPSSCAKRLADEEEKLDNLE